MKIAVVTDALYPYNKGGKEKRIYDLTQRLSNQNTEITIYCMKWWPENKPQNQGAVRLEAICPYLPLYTGNRRSIIQGLVFGISCLGLLFKDFDILEVDHMPYFPIIFCKIVSLIKSKKMIGIWNEVWGFKYWVNYLGPLGVFPAILEKLIINFPNKIISISQHTTNKLKSLNPNLNIETIGIGVESDRIIDIKKSEFSSDIIFAGRLLAHKNVDVLVNSMKLIVEKFQNLKLHIIGDGPEMKNLIKKVSELKLQENIKFLGFIESHDEILSLIKASKILALPSDREGFGIVAIEANACGIPVVTSDSENNATKELIIDGVNGYTVGNKPENYSSALLKLLQTPLPTESCINEAKKHDWKNIINAYRKVYSDL